MLLSNFHFRTEILFRVFLDAVLLDIVSVVPIDRSWIHVSLLALSTGINTWLRPPFYLRSRKRQDKCKSAGHNVRLTYLDFVIHQIEFFRIHHESRPFGTGS